MLDSVTDLRALLKDPTLLPNKAYVAGEWVDAADGATFAVTNPARGDIIARVPDLTRADAARAIAAADKARHEWAARTGKERAAILRKWYDLCLVHQDDLGTILTAEQGKPLAEAKAARTEQAGAAPTEAERAQDVATTLALMANALTETAKDRDAKAARVTAEEAKTAAVALQKQQLESRNAIIFGKLEDALTISVEPLNKMFTSVGLNPDDLIATVRSGYSGQGGPLAPISFSSMGLSNSPDEPRINAILHDLDTLNLYRIAAFKVPLGVPLQSRFRLTSGFGGRNDPINGSARMHEGQDLAGDYGTSIFATADGTVTYAGWEGGYGRLIKIRHIFGIETRYGHLSQIDVKVGQKISRGEKIGDMGNSGRSTGTHLHYEVRLSGKPVNPMTFIKAARDVF